MHAFVDRIGTFLIVAGTTTLLVHGAHAQPLCDVLLRPAFHYTTVGTTVLLQDSSTGFLEQTSCTWSFGDGALASVATYTHTYAQPGIYPVCYTITDSVSGCSSTFCRDVLVPLNTCTGLEAAFEESATNNNSAALVDLSTAPPGTLRLWELGNGVTSADSVTNHFWPLPGRHFVSLTRYAPDLSCASTTGAWLRVDGNGSTCGTAVFADFTWQEQGGALVFQPTLQTNGAIVAGVVWSFGDGHVDTSWTVSHTYAEAGHYQVCMLAASLLTGSQDSCFALVCHTVADQAITGVGDQIAGPMPEVFPNPFSDRLMVRVVDGAEGALVRLLDPAGREVVRHRLVGGSAVLDTGRLAAGIYLVDVSLPGGAWRSRVVHH